MHNCAYVSSSVVVMLLSLKYWTMGALTQIVALDIVGVVRYTHG